MTVTIDTSAFPSVLGFESEVTYIGLGGQSQEHPPLHQRRRTRKLSRGRSCSSRRQ
jgi:hypothetical protein